MVYNRNPPSRQQQPDMTAGSASACPTASGWNADEDQDTASQSQVANWVQYPWRLCLFKFKQTQLALLKS
ncbi:hypothetical protein VTN77DRAFT_3555 [Rasamsonia byssochlamydoides]|uniref:uncharacterized protein n=1 Tax=Rasamsonia byssochlamydoides TaxID=89139 RepID=UPI003742083E